MYRAGLLCVLSLVEFEKHPTTSQPSAHVLLEKNTTNRFAALTFVLTALLRSLYVTGFFSVRILAARKSLYSSLSIANTACRIMLHLENGSATVHGGTRRMRVM